MKTISTQYVRNILKERPADMHKGQAGRVLIIAGSKGMAGAAVLALRGALYSGAGLVKALVPAELINIIQIAVPEAMCLDRDEKGRGDITCSDDFFREFDSIAMGPGLGVTEDNHKLIRTVLESYSGPVVLDADALNCIARFGFPKRCVSSAILTPHPGEADRLLGSFGSGTVGSLGRKAAAGTLAEKTGAVVLLKGAGTIIAECSREHADGCHGTGVYINPTGNPGMAAGGSGDVLTGIIAALAAGQYLDAQPVEAACAGAFIHGLAGDIAAENIGEIGMTSADIADAVSVAFKEIMNFQ